MILIIKFLKKYAIIILMVIVAISLGVFKFLKRKPQDQTANANDILASENVSNDDATRINSIALNLAHNLGTAYAWYDPRSFTENDQEVFDALENISQFDFNLVAKLYHDVYAKGQTLSSDLARLLDDKLYKLLTVK